MEKLIYDLLIDEKRKNDLLIDEIRKTYYWYGDDDIQQIFVIILTHKESLYFDTDGVKEIRRIKRNWRKTLKERELI